MIGSTACLAWLSEPERRKPGDHFLGAGEWSCPETQWRQMGAMVAGRGDGVADHAIGRHFWAPRRVCSGLRTATQSMGLFFQFRTHFVPMKYPYLMKPK